MSTGAAKRLPYLRGSVPGALAVLLFADGVIGILAIAVYLPMAAVNAIRGSYLEGLSMLTTTVVLVPDILMGFGALRLYRGHGGGAAVILTACKFRKVILIIGMIALELAALITFFSSVQYRIGAALISLLIYQIGFGFVMLYFFFVRRIQDMMEIIMTEAKGPETPCDIRGMRSPGWMAILYTALYGTAGTALLFLPGIMSIFENYLPFSTTAVYTVQAFLLFVRAAALCLTAAFAHGFRLSHRGSDALSEKRDLCSACYVKAPAAAVLGMVFAGFAGLRCVQTFITSFSIGRLPNWVTIAALAAYTILAVSLLFRCRNLMILIASSIFFVSLMIRVFIFRPAPLTLIDWLVAIVFHALLSVAAILCLKPGKTLAKWLRIPLIILAVTDGVLSMAADVSYWAGILARFLQTDAQQTVLLTVVSAAEVFCPGALLWVTMSLAVGKLPEPELLPGPADETPVLT